MGRVVSDGKFTIYVYVERGGKHHKPHCHVMWAEGETILEIPSLNQITGDPLRAPALPAPARIWRYHHKEVWSCGP
nr:hypothetical protein [Chloroflexota bacterium]